ncbi:thiocillin family RiPP [Nonomuraea sediminis]|uniref:thiocillin family RiPP n=1 Tax=Nonomuraea sediminis TaxID=2835864 RepID=UPI001BDC2D9E|nr:thiocillin family RiPP [Nonomuraea sediminis]
MTPDQIDLYAMDEGMALEGLPEGTALGSFSSFTSAGSLSCPFTSASSLTTAACLG